MSMSISERDKEFKKVYSFLKRWAKSPLAPSYTKGYSAGNADKEPAQKVYDYIGELEVEKISFEEKLNLLYDFLEKADEEYRKKPMVMGTAFYTNIQSHIKRERVKIERGEPVQTRRK